MSIEDAIELIRSKYEDNKDKKWVQNPVAYTLYEVWRITDSKAVYRPSESSKEEAKNFCGDCHWYEAEEMYCFRQGCHAYDESSCELWEPMPADEPIPAPGGKTVPTTYDLLYEEGGYNSNGV